MTLEHAGPDAPGCQARTALEMLSRGTDRLGTASQAELVFTDEACSRDVRCVWHGMTILLRAGELESVDEHLWRLERDRRGWWDDHVSLMRAEHAMHAGDLVGARATLARLTASALPESLRDLALPCYLEVLVAVNEAELANQVLRQHDFDLLQRKWPTLHPLLLAVRGWLHLISGRTEQAYQDLRKCSRLPAAEVAATFSVARRRGVLALAAAATGEHEVALAAATQEYEVAKAWRSHAHMAWGLYVLEMIEDSDQPSDRFRDAIDLLELARSPAGVATVCYEQGKRLLASGQHLEGRAHLLRAEKSARRIGDAVLTEKIEKLLCELTNSIQRTPLTMQELRIAELTQNGYSNKQIADRLVLTVRTVEFHLSNVYRKLGISGRRALAAEILPSRLS